MINGIYEAHSARFRLGKKSDLRKAMMIYGIYYFQDTHRDRHRHTDRDTETETETEMNYHIS